MSTRGHAYDVAPCQYCNEPIALNSLKRHEADCQTATPAQRLKRKTARTAGRERTDRVHKAAMVQRVEQPQTNYYQRRKANGGRPLRELQAATAHASAMLNGKPDDLVELTIALPRSVVMDMLIQGLPHASIVSIGGWRLQP